MPQNSIIKNSIVVGGLTFAGYIAGGKLGSMLGAVIGTVVCSLFNTEQPQLQSRRPNVYLDDDSDDQTTLYYPIQRKNNNKRRKMSKGTSSESKLSKCSICLEQFKPTILLLPCSHMCFCDECYEKVRKQKISTCPICRKHIGQIKFVYPS